MPYERYHQTQEDEPLKKRVVRAGRYAGAVVGSALAFAGGGLSTASAAETVSTRPVATAENSPPKGEKLVKELQKDIAGAIKKANNSKDPNIFYGAIVFAKTYDSTGKRSLEPINLAPSKYLFYKPKYDGRVKTDVGLPTVLIDPVIEQYNGRLYAITYDRGNIKGELNMAAKDAITSGRDIFNYRFIDLGDADELNDGLTFYQHNGIKPRMLKSYVRDGMRFIKADSEKYPQMSPLGMFLQNFSRDQGDELSIGNYMTDHGLSPMSPYYKPPFKIPPAWDAR